ncbi:MAG: hypothetical protein HY885_08655 [Deltaproteobacteria bacterium]|nr:hypothetical protein [Deltaproteobacteria bacterium]
MKINTVRLSVTDLGFPEGALTREIIGSERDRDLFGNPAPFTGGRAKQLGLKLCPPDVGPLIRLEYKDQPPGERLHIAMKPITDSDGEPRIFVVAHDIAGLSLDAALARSNDKWEPDDLFVFCFDQSTTHDNQ